MSTALGRSAAAARTPAAGAFFTPCTVTLCQRRTAAVSLLDKLHRRQREQDRDERKNSALRAPSVELPPPPSPSSTTATLLPYHIARTPSKQLPVYIESKNGGNLHQTRVRKIDGDINRLRDELRVALGLDSTEEERKKVVINFNTKHVVIKGWRKPEVEAFLEKRGF